MALAIHISSYVSGGFTNPVIWRLYETGTGVFVDDHQEMGPHGVVYNFSWVNNIRDIVYTIKMYDQPGGTGVGNLIKSHDVTVSTSTLTMDADIETIVDGGNDEDPVSGTNTSPIIPALVGKSFYVVQRGIGQLLATRNIEIIDNLDGSYSLTGDSTFNPGDTYIIKIRAQYVVNPAGSQSISIYKDIVLITANTTLTSADFGKILIVDGATPVITLQLPVIADIIEKLSIWIESVGTTHINVVVKAAIGETITATGTASNTFILSKAVKAEIIKVGSTLFGFTNDNDIKQRGQIEWGYSVGLNRLWANGTEYLVANYPGLKKAMDAMQTGTVVTYALWNSSQTITYAEDDIETIYPYKGFFALSDDGLNFKVPDLRNLSVRALRYSDSTTDDTRITQGAGGYQLQSIRKHNHNINTSNSGGSSSDTTDPVRSSLEGTINTRGGEGSDKTISQYIDPAGSIETRATNIGLIPLIII